MNIKTDNILTSVTSGARALVLLETLERAGTAVEAGPVVARVGDGYLAEGSAESERARAREAGRQTRRHAHFTRTAVLAPGARACVARIRVLAVLPNEHRRTTKNKQ